MIAPSPDERLRPAGRNRQPQTRSTHDHRNRGHRRTGQGRLEGRGTGQRIPRQHPEHERHHPRPAPASTTATSPTWTGRSTPCATRGSSTPSCNSRTSRPSRTGSPRRRRPPPRAATSRPSGPSELLLRDPRPPSNRAGAPARSNWTGRTAGLVADLNLLTDKPVLYVCNVDEKSAVTGNAHTEAVRAAIADEKAEMLVIAAATEADIAELGELRGAANVPRRHGPRRVGRGAAHRSGLQIAQARKRSFTTGADETRASTCSRGMKAPQTAGIIHTDFERGFDPRRSRRTRTTTAWRSDRRRRAGRRGQDRHRRQGIRRAGRRHHALPVQRRPAPPDPPRKDADRSGRHVMFNLKTTEP